MNLREDLLGGVTGYYCWEELQLRGRPLTFGVSGYLYNDNLVMYDHQTNTLWSQLLGQAMRGAWRPTQLSILPSLLTRWGEWKAARPATLILSAQRVEQVAAADIVDPYAGYYASGAAGFSSELALDQRLPSKTWVVGLLAGADARAYPLETMRQETLINDQLGVLSALLIFEPELEAVLIYNRQTAAQTLTFAWAAIHPDTTIYEAESLPVQSPQNAKLLEQRVLLNAIVVAVHAVQVVFGIKQQGKGDAVHVDAVQVTAVAVKQQDIREIVHKNTPLPINRQRRRRGKIAGLISFLSDSIYKCTFFIELINRAVECGRHVQVASSVHSDVADGNGRIRFDIIEKIGRGQLHFPGRIKPGHSIPADRNQISGQSDRHRLKTLPRIG